jgi:hypothetical protein
MVSMLDRAKAIKAKQADLCDRENSGFHDNDKRELGRPCSSQNRGLPSVRDHVIAFQGRWEHTIVGEDATRVHMALKGFVEENEAVIAETSGDQSLRCAVVNSKEYVDKGIANGTLVIRNGQWNDIVHALDLCKIGVTVAGEECPKNYDPKNPQ